MIIAVTSPPGAGKTHWISQQIAQVNKPQVNKPLGYFSPQQELNLYCKLLTLIE